MTPWLLLAAVTMTQVDVAVPSPDGTGSTGGALRVRVFVPPAAATLFPEGAPVLVEVPGGTSAGDLAAPRPPLDRVVVVKALLPGGCFQGVCSDGAYDRRGERSALALADVLAFASGAATDSLGRTIGAVAGIPVLTDNVGVAALSNGGALATVTLATHGGALPGVRWLLGWENPTTSQAVVGDGGPGANQDCAGPAPGARPRFANPYYLGYGTPVLDIDYSRIAYDTGADKVFLDGNGNGVWDTVPDAAGCGTPDVDRDGTLEVGEDFGLASSFDEPSGRRHFSVQTVAALAEHGVFAPSSWPAWLDTPEEAEAFWRGRETVWWYEKLGSHRPDLRVILVASTEDHVQTLPDHPHIRQAFEGLDGAGVWVKLNPAPESLVALDARLAGRHDLPDMLPGIAPLQWTDVSWTVPEDLANTLLEAAAAHELATMVRDAAEASPVPRVRRRLGR